MTVAQELVATGTVASEGTAVGVLTPVGSVAEVLALLKGDAGDVSEAILLTEHASVTSVVPILPRVRGVICKGGGVTSHIAIISRQFSLPCIVAAQLSIAAADAAGLRVGIEADGRVVLAAES
jgi:phosphoenolpyruvate-protein kinase (PTS system EI component)